LLSLKERFFEVHQPENHPLYNIFLLNNRGLNKILKVFITIDTEEDDWGSYKSDGFRLENISYLPILQKIIDRYGAVPTYLVTYPVMADKDSKRIISGLLDSGRCEIGAHCHPWNTPPFEDLNDKNDSMLCNLNAELVAKKVENLHQIIKDSLDVEPRCFRAGRWGFRENVATAIHGLGYTIDTSVTPFVDWSAYGGPNFSMAIPYMYRFNPNNVFSPEEEGPLFEIPVTTGFYQQNVHLCNLIRGKIIAGPLARLRLIGLLDKLGLINFRWLSPELSNGMEMIHLAKTLMKSEYTHLNMSFHSTTLLPGRGPFVRSKQDLEVFLRNIEMFLQFAAEENMSFARLSDHLMHPVA
jgi:hypothetical protein